MAKRCALCAEVKAYPEFMINKRDGSAGTHTRCSPCRANYAREYYRANVLPRTAARYRARVVESLPGEEWRDSYPGYSVSSLGRVKSTRFGDRLLRPAYCGGYAYVNVPTVRRLIQVHRLVARAFHGEPPDGHECDHIDRDRANNTAANLRWVTHKENMANRAPRPRQ